MGVGGKPAVPYVYRMMQGWIPGVRHPDMGVNRKRSVPHGKEGSMMHQRVEQEAQSVELCGRPQRETVIDNDDVISIRIDLEILDRKAFFDKYFSKP